VIQLVVERLEGSFDVGKIHHPTGVCSKLAVEMDFDAEGVPVQTGTLVPFRHIRQTVRRFEREDFENIHDGIVLPACRHPSTCFSVVTT